MLCIGEDMVGCYDFFFLFCLVEMFCIIYGDEWLYCGCFGNFVVVLVLYGVVFDVIFMVFNVFMNVLVDLFIGMICVELLLSCVGDYIVFEV